MSMIHDLSTLRESRSFRIYLFFLFSSQPFASQPIFLFSWKGSFVPLLHLTCVSSAPWVTQLSRVSQGWDR
jgi:hypothetical protein